MLTLDQIQWSKDPVLPPKPDPGLFAELQERYGLVSDLTSYITSVPWVARRAAEFTAYRPPGLPLDLTEFASLVITQENSCRYCWGACRASLKLLGYREDKILQLEQSSHSLDHLSEQHRGVLDLARRIARASPPPARGDLEALEKLGLDRATLHELVYFCAVRSSFGSRLATPLAVPPSILESQDARWKNRMFWGRLVRSLRKRASSGARPSWDERHAAAPFARFVRAVEEVPSSGALQTALDDAWASPVTTRRLKALVFATVGYSLSVQPVVDEAVRLLQDEGLAPDEGRAAIRDLASPRLTDVETAAIQFARETVRYRTDHIQERCKALRDRVTEDVLVEILGLCAMANSLSRLAVLLELG